MSAMSERLSDVPSAQRTHGSNTLGSGGAAPGGGASAHVDSWGRVADADAGGQRGTLRLLAVHHVVRHQRPAGKARVAALAQRSSGELKNLRSKGYLDFIELRYS